MNDWLISETFNSKEIPDNENQKKKKKVNIVGKILSDLACTAKDSNCKAFECKQLKILTPKQMLQRLLLAFAQVKAGNTSENLLNEIRQIIYSLYQAKEITKKRI